MKIFFIIVALLASLFLTACQQNENDNFSDNSSNYEANDGYPIENHPTRRLSYDEYRNEYSITLLSTYSTPLLSKEPGRVNNIEIVCDKLNGYILNPEEIFSYNTVVGPYGPSEGFEEATILLSDGTKDEGYGGGVCQLSSTLYYLVKNMENIEIVERHQHSAPVAYISKGNDATVSLQSNLDLRFKNNNDYPIRFEADCKEDKVTVRAYKEQI